MSAPALQGNSDPVGTATMSSGLRDATNFHAWTFEWIRPFVTGRVLDIGGGTGNHFQHLTDLEMVSMDISSDCIADLSARYSDRSNWGFRAGDITDPAVVADLGEASFDTVLSCNVFEHIPDDTLAFHHAARLLKPGGRLVLILPAHKALYGCMDRLAGHYRRYDRQLANERLADCQLEPEHLRYVNLVGAVGWFINNRIMSHDDLSSGSINRQIHFFDRYAIPVLRTLEGARSMPFGQSLICVGVKPDLRRQSSASI